MSKQQQQKKNDVTSCSSDVLCLQFSILMNNLLSYCGLIQAKIRASDKDLPVICLADIELLLAWLWALELLVPVIITAWPSWAMAVENICSHYLVIYLIFFHKTDILKNFYF